MLYVKIALALILTGIPFIFKHLVFPKKDSVASCRNLFSAIGSKIPLMKKLRQKIFNLSVKFYHALKHSIAARKFFTLILLLLMLTVVMVDFNASASVARIVNNAAQQSAKNTERLIELYNEYSPYITYRYATLLAGIMIIPFFSFKVTDKLLSLLSRSRRVFIVLCAATILLTVHSAAFSSGRNMVVPELLYLVLGASALYPSLRCGSDLIHTRAIPKNVLDRLYAQKYFHSIEQ